MHLMPGSMEPLLEAVVVLAQPHTHRPESVAVSVGWILVAMAPMEWLQHSRQALQDSREAGAAG